MSLAFDTTTDIPRARSKSAENLAVSAKPALNALAFRHCLESASYDAHAIKDLLSIASGVLSGMVVSATEIDAYSKLSTLIEIAQNLAEKVSETWPDQPLTN